MLSLIRKIERKFLIIIAILVLLYIAFLICDIFFPSVIKISSYLKYTGILLCLLMSVIVYFQSEYKRAAKLQIIILCFTVTADFFLLFTSNFQMGMFVFLGAHLFAILRYYPKLVKYCLLSLVLACVIWIISLLVNKPLDLMFCLPVTYLVLIIVATITTFVAKQDPVNNFLSRCGMLLFILCDINVALFNSVATDSALYSISSILMWAFYLPAQIMLSLSAYDFRVKKSIKSINS